MGGKSLWAIILMVCLLASSIPIFIPAEAKASGLNDIDADGYLDIYDVYDLQNMNLDLDANYELMNDIDASVTAGWNGGAGFLPIGGTDGSHSFTGSLNGNGFAINGLNVNHTIGQNLTKDIASVGLFGDFSGEVSDIYLNYMTLSCNVTDSEYVWSYMGAIAGIASGTIARCTVNHVSLNISGESACDDGNYRVGGMIGEAAYVNMEGCFASGILDIDLARQVSDAWIPDYVYLGGLIGEIRGTNTRKASITDCVTSVHMTYAHQDDVWITAGGLLGHVCRTDISRSYSDGYITGVSLAGDSWDTLGGLVGEFTSINSANASSTISQCFADVDCTPILGDAGGFVGYMSSGYLTTVMTIEDSFARGAVTGGDGSGGFCAYASASGSASAVINRCYSTGSVGGVSAEGGFCAHRSPSATISDCAWDIETSGIGTSDGGVGKTTSQMKDRSTYEGWDFDTVWGIDPAVNDGYPFLRVESGSQAPAITTGYASEVNRSTATLSGFVTSLGSANSVDVYFEYRPEGSILTRATSAITITQEDYQNDGTSFLGISYYHYSLPIGSLSSDTTYRFRAVAIGDGTTTGNWHIFKTKEDTTWSFAVISDLHIVTDK